MKKHILFLMHYLELGGAEAALIGLLNTIDFQKYDVDLFLYSHQGELMKYIPRDVKLLPQVKKYSMLEKPIKELIKNGVFDIAFARLIAKIKTLIYAKVHPTTLFDSIGFQNNANCTTFFLPSINPRVTYDVAVSFLTPHNICRDKVCATKKICWIHTDYKTIRINKSVELPIWSSFDKIVSISKDVTNSFVNVFPTLSPRIVEIENILSPVMIRNRSIESEVEHEFFDNMGNATNLLSIGRFCSAKNYDNVPDICRRILNLGINVRWYIIGFGIDGDLIKSKIREYGMENNVILLGKRTNPYPYIRACDIYVQPSRFEGKSVTVREAQVLCKPVVVTNYPTASSQIINGVDGIIVPMDNEGCAEGIARFIKNKTLQRSISLYLNSHDYGGELEIEKFYDMIEL